MRILFCGCDGLFSGLVLAQLVARADLEVVGVVRSTRVLRARYGFLQGAWHQVRQSGLAYALHLWGATALTEVLGPRSLGRLVRRHAIPMFATRNVNDPAGLAFTAASRPDLLVAAFFNQRIGPDLLRMPRMAAVNVHPSLLPDFKGVDPVFFARLRGAPRLGVTVHQIEADLDTGRILVQQDLPVPPAESVFRTTARLFALGGRLLAGELTGPLAPQSGTPQSGPGSYDSWPSAAQVGLMRRRGIRLLRLDDLLWAVRGAGDPYASCP
jgi:methionyl-tRNA formyltransferase